ncbi:MAG TPA: hypothetical protein VHZ73_12045 [Vicinamibacterales bacterium]|jgi:hypothetical protein|nr:hypothetical protein [Vicinamibacterales bacterium]
MRPRAFATAVLLAGALFLAAAYARDLGRGFVKDDAPWIQTAMAAIEHPSSAFMVDSSGFFFRPLVTASFAADYTVYGTSARGYGVTNFLLCVCCAGAILWMLLDVGITPAGASAAVLAWAINPHGIGMALLWISGRTSLLMTLCSTLAVVAFMRKHHAVAALLLLAALFAKEDAIAVPVIAVACALAARRGNWRAMAVGLVWMAGAVAVYLALRMRTSAMTPATAPWYYRLITSPGAIAINALSYLDRAGTSAAVIAGVALAIYGIRDALTRALGARARFFAAGALWFLAGIAITVRVPVRSDLYALFPSIGFAIACGAAIDALRSSAPASGLAWRDRMLIAAAWLLLLLVPVYWSRDTRFSEPAELSAQVQRQLATDLASLPPAGTIVFEDAPGRFSTFGDAFDGMASSVVQLFTGRHFTADIVMPPATSSAPDEVARYAIKDGRVVRLR